MLLVDSGNFSDNPTLQGDIKTRGLIEGMGRLGYAASNVGDRDLSLGYNEFRGRTEPATFPFVSANIVRQDTQQPVFDPYVVVKAVSPDGKVSLRVGILGAARYNPLFLKAGPDGSNLVIAKPGERLKRYIDEVRAKSDVVVLLAALHKEEAKRIIRAVPGIDFVVGSYGGMITAREEKEGSTWLLYAGNQGKRIGETRVYRGGQRDIVSAETTMHLLSRAYPGDKTMLDFVNEVANKVAESKKQAGNLTQGGAGASR